MNTIQKFRAIMALDSMAALKLSTDNSWYVAASIEKSEGGFLEGGAEYRSDPLAAIEAYWTKVSSWKYAYSRGRYCRWNDFMWLDVTEERKAEKA